MRSIAKSSALLALLLLLLLLPASARAENWQMWVHHGGTFTRFNASEVDSVTFVFVDTIPPDAPILSAVTGAGPGSIVLDWTAVGDDGSIGAATSQELRASTVSGTPFEDMTPVPGVPAPQPAGSAESFTASGLAENQNYCFRLRVQDEFGNSATSNEACAVTASAAGNLVIAEVFGGAGAGSSTFNQDYIVLFNRTAVPISLDGYSIQFAPSGGSSWNINPFFGGHVVKPHGYFLIAVGPPSGTGAALPPQDFMASGNINTSSGKVALMSNNNPTAGVCPPPTFVIDLVGYGGADCFESAATPPLSNSSAAIRLAQGCQDTNNNFADFVVGFPSPRNSFTPIRVCP